MSGGEEDPKRNGYHRLDHVHEPEDRSGKTRAYAWVSADELHNVLKRNKWKYYNLQTALSVLQNPRRVFKFIRPNERSSDGEHRPGWCFSRVMRELKGEDGVSRYPCWGGTVFSVYLNADLSVFEWGLDEADPKDPQSPLGARQGLGTTRGRFGELVWEATHDRKTAP